MSARYLSPLWILRHVYSTACFILSCFLTCMYFSNRSANNNVTTRSMNPRHFEWVWAVQKMVFCTLHKSCHLRGKNHVHCLHIKRQDAAYYGICQDTENMASPSVDVYLIFYGNRELNCHPKWRITAIQIQVLSCADCLPWYAVQRWTCWMHFSVRMLLRSYSMLTLCFHHRSWVIMTQTSSSLSNPCCN